MDKFATKIIGNNIKEIRFKKNMSQDKLSKLTGISRSTISKIETGYRDPSLAMAYSISKALDEPIRSVFIIEENNDIEETILN